MKSKLKIFSGREGITLAEEISAQLSLPVSNVEIKKFPDGEIGINILESVRGCDIFIVNPTNPPAENLIELLLLTRAVKEASAERITIIPSYLGYSRQDKKDSPYSPVSAKLISQILSNSGADQAVLIDVHSKQGIGFFDINVEHLQASLIGIPYFKRILGENFIIASPDIGGAFRAKFVADKLGIEDYLIFQKKRLKTREVRMTLPDDIILKGKNILFIDDIIDTGHTVIKASEEAKERGVNKIFVFATHAVLSRGALNILDKSFIEEIIITDTIFHFPKELETKKVKITVLSVSEILAQVIRRIHENEDLDFLYE